jgi:hypothetical protein
MVIAIGRTVGAANLAMRIADDLNIGVRYKYNEV